MRSDFSLKTLDGMQTGSPVLVARHTYNLNASKPSEHPPSGGTMSKGLGGNIIGCGDKTSS